MKDLECPYCEHGFDYDRDGMGDGDSCEGQCPECEKYFVFYASVSINYSTYKADCLNGAPHDLKMSKSYPVEYSKLRCTTCNYQEKPTKEQLEALE